MRVHAQDDYIFRWSHHKTEVVFWWGAWRCGVTSVSYLHWIHIEHNRKLHIRTHLKKYVHETVWLFVLDLIYGRYMAWTKSNRRDTTNRRIVCRVYSYDMRNDESTIKIYRSSIYIYAMHISKCRQTRWHAVERARRRVIMIVTKLCHTD